MRPAVSAALSPALLQCVPLLPASFVVGRVSGSVEWALASHCFVGWDAVWSLLHGLGW